VRGKYTREAFAFRRRRLLKRILSMESSGKESYALELGPQSLFLAGAVNKQQLSTEG